MMGDILSPVHIILLFAVALLVFGPKRLPEIGSSIGRGIRELKHALASAVDDGEKDGISPPKDSSGSSM
ncbi:MAG: twin-arginine translocase TatA/TatE family subunit [Firmicutes bacterium]|nr:twin-arginine translocase TatA/TatE family subunit [Bacillota bacterium]